jgi:diphthamide biosynthesis methyltransferase
MQVILTYSDEAFAKLASYANANSKTLEQYLRSNLSWAAKQFISVDVIDNGQSATLTRDVAIVTVGNPVAATTEPELYISDKPYVSKRKKKPKVKSKKRTSKKVCV